MITVKDFLPNITSNRSGKIQQRKCLWLITGAFSVTSESLSDRSVGCNWALYCMFISGSESMSQSLMNFLGSTRWRGVVWSQVNFFNLIYENFLFDELVIVLESSVMGGLPKCASNGLILVETLGISLIGSIFFVTSEKTKGGYVLLRRFFV